MKDLEAQIEEGRAVKDMIETDGWKIVEQKIKEEIEDERRALLEIRGKDIYSTAVEFIEHQKMMQGLERVFEIIRELLTTKENAESRLKGEK